MTMNSKIKIVYIITGTGIGGAEKILYHTVTGLNNNHYSVSVCSLKERGEIARDLERQGIEVHCLKMENKEGFIGWLTTIGSLIRLIPYLRKLQPTIVHSFLFRANIVARIASYITSIPIVISSIRVMGGEKNYFHYLERMTSFMVDHYITVSESVKDYLVRKSRIPLEKVSVIYNGVNIKEHNSLKMPNQRVIGAEDKVVITVGRLHTQKGHSYLLQAIAKVQKEISKVKVLVIGEGEEENNLKNLAKSLDLTDKIIFAGLRVDVEEILPEADLFVLPSLWEGMPNALLEAMALGIPVVATDVGGIPEVVIHEETGILIPPKDSDALASAMIDLLQNNFKAQKMGEAGRDRVEKHFSLARTIEKTECLYKKLLEGKQLL